MRVHVRVCREELLQSLLPLMGEAIATVEREAGGPEQRPAMSIEAQRFAQEVGR